MKRDTEPFLRFLKDRFKAKINPKEYYLAYSGGKDSHFIYWFIREYMGNKDIEIVGVNTTFEIPEIRERIYAYSDRVLLPALKRDELKSVYGIPCFSKQQDEYIHRYQNGSRSENTMNAVLGRNIKFNLNRKARELLLSGKLHKVSNKCCLYNKELPMIQYGKQIGKKAIIGVRQSESITRKSKYNSCLQTNGNFTPIYDFSDLLMATIYKEFEIEIPGIYKYLDRTGCAGCPYGRKHETELVLLPDNQRKETIDFFRESYDVKGIEYQNIQQVLKLW